MRKRTEAVREQRRAKEQARDQAVPRGFAALRWASDPDGWAKVATQRTREEAERIRRLVAGDTEGTERG